jgi:hypothetical protein
MLPAYTDIDLPKIPDFLIKKINDYAAQYLQNEGQSTFKRYTDAGYFNVFKTDTEIEQWASENIVLDYDKHYLTRIQIVKDQGMSPHIDPPINPPENTIRRYYTLLYLVDVGNNHELPTTNFYKLIKNNSSKIPDIFNHDEVEKFYSVQFKPYSWGLLCNQHIHGVENVTNPRIGLSLSFFDPDLPEFLKKQIQALPSV